jgi:hypothetical protein
MPTNTTGMCPQLIDGTVLRRGTASSTFFFCTLWISESRDTAAGFIRMCGGDGAATIAVAPTGVLSALGATLFAATPEAALRCPRQQRH